MFLDAVIVVIPILGCKHSLRKVREFKLLDFFFEVHKMGKTGETKRRKKETGKLTQN